MICTPEYDAVLYLGPVRQHCILQDWRFDLVPDGLGTIHRYLNEWIELLLLSFLLLIIDILDVGGFPIHEFKIKVPDFCQINFQVNGSIDLR